jgi:formate--tetrahydrofolate ligase
MRPITEVAADLDLAADELELYGRYKAKVRLEAAADRAQDGRLILVTAISPTPAGEGKTTVSVGLAQGLKQIGKYGCLCLREPSLGPCMGVKGGGCGGGRSQVVPMDEINLHFTGDIHAVSTAHNLLAALIDNHLYFGNALQFDTRRVLWKRVMDMNDRALRHIMVGVGDKHGASRETGFDITAASEVMAILCLSHNLQELQEKLKRIVVGFNLQGGPICCHDLKADGAMTVLLKDAIKPNLVQTLEGTPAFIHGGPFGNIAHGTNSIVATKMALRLADYVVIEAGFGSDLGAEKFFNIKCGYANLTPHAVVLVATVRALKMHGGVPVKELGAPSAKAVEAGLPNLHKHIENIRKLGREPVVAINSFASDTEDEIKIILDDCRSRSVKAVRASVHADGGKGAAELAEVVAGVADEAQGWHRPLYDWNAPIELKIGTIAREIYGARQVCYQVEAQQDIYLLGQNGFAKLPVCMCKTQSSLSDDPAKVGRPKDFVITVREVALAAGAGFIVPITGPIMRMPGLPKVPAAERYELSANGDILNLF